MVTLTAQNGDIPAPCRNQKDSYNRELIHYPEQYFGRISSVHAYLTPTGSGVILLLTVNVTKYVRFDL